MCIVDLEKPKKKDGSGWKVIVKVHDGYGRIWGNGTLYEEEASHFRYSTTKYQEARIGNNDEQAGFHIIKTKGDALDYLSELGIGLCSLQRRGILVVRKVLYREALFTGTSNDDTGVDCKMTTAKYMKIKETEKRSK